MRPSETTQGRAPMTLSSRDVARLLGVGEATIKRWADDGLLPCRKTPGGHRRFALSAVAAFRRKQPGWAESWPDSPDVARQALLKKALAGDGEGLTRLVLAGIDQGLAIEALCDDWLSPMLVHVGDAWSLGELAIAQEHITSAAVSEMLSQLAPLLVREPLVGVAVTGCLPGERHELGSRMAGLILRTEHYRVIQVGAEAPLKDLVQEVMREGADILTLSGQINQPETVDALRELSPWALREQVRVFVGGNGFSGQLLPHGIEWLGSFSALRHALQESTPGGRGPARAARRQTDRSE